MLQRSFVHIPGIGPAKEKNLWSKGIHTWDHLEEKAPTLFKEERLDEVLGHLDTARRAYAEGDLCFFYKNLPREQLWRLIPGNLDKIAYLDIETTGTGFPPLSYSTTITFYFQGKIYQEHEFEKKRQLIDRIVRECSIICTFFGEVFDVPYLRHEFGIPFDKAHIDLCFWLKRLGYKGGLKRVQKLFPDIPERLSLDIDGFDAVRLWHLHQRGIHGALETLLTYNAEDTVVLEPLLIKAFNKEVDRNLQLALEKLPDREMATLETRSHPEVYSLLRNTQ